MKLNVRHKREFILLAMIVFVSMTCVIPNNLQGTQFVPSHTVEPTTIDGQIISKTTTVLPSQTANIVLTHTSAVVDTPTPPFTPTLLPYPTNIADDKGVEMVLVPAGEFTMGNDRGQEYERPAHKVYLDSFYIDIYEVTNRRYKDCVDTGVCHVPLYIGSETRSSYYGNLEYEDYPVIYVNWEMAQTYCEWRGAQLPTEAQWEKAARGTDGRTYPWGEGIDCTNANYWDSTRGICVGDTTKVGSYEGGKSSYGAYDMAGNVWEWVADWYLETYYQNSPASNPLGPATGDMRSLRGGGWAGLINQLYTFGRHVSLDEYPVGYIDAGFRCAKTVP